MATYTPSTGPQAFLLSKKPKLTMVPQPMADLASLQAAVAVLKHNMDIITSNAGGDASSQIFALAGQTGKLTGWGSNSSTGALCSIQFTLSASSIVLLTFGYTGIATSAAGNLQAVLDGGTVSVIPLARTGGSAYPLQGSAVLANVGSGLHNLSVNTTTGLSGLYATIIGFGQ